MTFLAFLLALALRLLPVAGGDGAGGPLSAWARLGAHAITPAAGGVRWPLAILWAFLPGLLAQGLVTVTGSGWLRFVLTAGAAFLALGPGGMHREVAAYRDALARGDGQAARRAADGLGAAEAARRAALPAESVAAAILVAGSTRLFGPLACFLALGPLGPAAAIAWRVTLLQSRLRPGATPTVSAAPAPDAFWARLHGSLAYLPARLAALGYGVAGDFAAARAGWRGYLASGSRPLFEANDGLVVHAGLGALGARWTACADEGARATLALGLVDAATLLWLALFALAALQYWLV